MAFIHKRKEIVPRTKSVHALIAIRFFLALGNAVIMTIWALYLNSFVGSASMTGYISTFLTLISFLSYFAFIPLIEKHDKNKLFSWSLFLTAASHILFAFITKSLLAVVVISVITILTQAIRITVYGIIFKDIETKKSLVKDEGLMFTFANIAFLIGPLLAGYLTRDSSFSLAFIIGSLCMFLGYVVFKFSEIKDHSISKKVDGNILKNFFEFFKNKDRVIAYLVGGGVQLWWAFIFLFIPIYMVDQGLSAKYVGYFIFATSIPLILTEYYFSKKTSKIGYKKMFVLGYLITAIFCLVCFFFSNVFIILALLTLASFGMALLEPTTEAYFLQVSNRKQTARFFGPYNTNANTTSIIGKLLASSLLLLLPFKFMFILFAVFMLFFFLVSFKTRNL